MAIAIEQVETAADIGQTDAFCVGVFFFLGDRVLDMEEEMIGLYPQADRQQDIADIVLYPVLEAVLEEEDEDHRRDLDSLGVALDVERNGETVTKAELFD